MNTPVVRHPRPSVASPKEHLLNRVVARAALRHWRLRQPGEPLCDTDLPDLHAMLVVPPQQVALETTLRNERALKRYYAARVDYRERLLEGNFDHVVIPTPDGVKGGPRAARIPVRRDPHVVSVHPLRSPLPRIGGGVPSHGRDGDGSDPDPHPIRTTRVS